MDFKFNKLTFISACLLVFLCFTWCSTKNRISFTDTNAKWKYKLGDDLSYSAPEYDDSAWDKLETNRITMNKTHYCWIRTTLTVPAKMRNQKIYLGSERTNCAIALEIKSILDTKTLWIFNKKSADFSLSIF